MRISFLIMNAFGTGGTIRATQTLAGELARRHDVEILSVFRHRDAPALPVDGRVRIRTMIDQRPSKGRRWWQRVPDSGPSLLVHPQERAYGSFSAESDEVITRTLRKLKTDVLISTRPGLNILVARHVSPRIIRIGQEHLHFGAHGTGLLGQIRSAYKRLDAVVTLTEADHDDYARMLAGEHTRVRAIGNGLPAGNWPQSELDNRIVAAAGRLVPVKRYDQLLDAFAIVVEKCPGWRLRIYGRGPQYEELTAQTRALGLHDHVTFMGQTADMAGELAKSSVHVVSSRFEGFGMTILEAFRCGVPVVSFDCPRGPREIITPGHDGLLVPSGDIGALSEALITLMTDDAMRSRMAANALETGARYDISSVAGHWESLLTELGQ